MNDVPAIVYANCETAIHNTVRTIWPGLEVKACRFHLGQSWRWKMRSSGLSKLYGKRDCEVGQFLKKTFGLSLLPPAEDSDSFVLEFLPNLPKDKRMERFLRLSPRKLY